MSGSLNPSERKMKKNSGFRDDLGEDVRGPLRREGRTKLGEEMKASRDRRKSKKEPQDNPALM